MAYDVWPADLPQKMEIQSYARGVGDGRLRTRTDTGPGKVRRRSSAMADLLKGTMQMTAAQIVSLRAFVKTTLLGGSLPFTFPEPEGDGTASVTVRFAAALPSWTALSHDLFSVSLDLEVLP